MPQQKKRKTFILEKSKRHPLGWRWCTRWGSFSGKSCSFALGQRSRLHMRSLTSSLQSVINALLNGQLAPISKATSPRNSSNPYTKAPPLRTRRGGALVYPLGFEPKLDGVGGRNVIQLHYEYVYMFRFALFFTANTAFFKK